MKFGEHEKNGDEEMDTFYTNNFESKKILDLDDQTSRHIVIELSNYNDTQAKKYLKSIVYS